MRTSAQIFLLVLLALSCTVSTYAQEALWKELIGKADMLYQQGQYSEAAKVTKEALTIAENTFGPGHPLVATSLNNLAFLYQAQGKYSEAEPLYKRSLKIREKALGPEHPNVATTLENMAKLYKKIGKEVEAERLEARAKRIHKGKDEMDQTSSWSVNTYGFFMYIPGYELLSGLITTFISSIILLIICWGLFNFFERTTKHPIRFYIWGIPIIAGIIYILPLIYMNFALRKSLENLSYLIYILQICIFFALSKPLQMIGRSKWAALWLIMPIYNMVVSWKWASEALYRPEKGETTKREMNNKWRRVYLEV